MGFLKPLISAAILALAGAGASGVLSEPPEQTVQAAVAYPVNAPVNVDMSQIQHAFH